VKRSDTHRPESAIRKIRRGDDQDSNARFEMKEGSTVRPEGRPRRSWAKSRAFALVGLLAIGATFPRGCRSRIFRALRAHAAKARLAQVAADAAAVPPVVCPALNSSPVQPVLPSEGGRRVILSWRASAPGDSKHDAAIGYCIYRGTGDKDPSPQLLNSTPLQGTRCADDWVKSAENYHYFIRAISARRFLSDQSNEVRVSIPADRRSSPSPAAAETPAPLCREPATRR